MSVLWGCFDNFRARNMNIILPVAGSGDFSRLPSIGTASQRSSLPVRARTGLAGATVGPHVTWKGALSFLLLCPGSLSDLEGADRLLPPEPSPGDPAQPLLTSVCPDLYTSALTMGLFLPCQHLSQTSVSRLHAAQPEGIWHSTRCIKSVQ